MYIMALIFTLGQLGARFKVKVIDCTASGAVDINDITNQKIVFYKPDGVRIEKNAVLVVDPAKPTESFIQYTNDSPEESIFDLRDIWEYNAEITLILDNIVETSQRVVFWVK
jgi:hypothetical protein